MSSLSGSFTELTLLDTVNHMLDSGALLLGGKARTLKIAAGLLAAALLVVTFDVVGRSVAG